MHALDACWGSLPAFMDFPSEAPAASSPSSCGTTAQGWCFEAEEGPSERLQPLPSASSWGASDLTSEGATARHSEHQAAASDGTPADSLPLFTFLDGEDDVSLTMDSFLSKVRQPPPSSHRHTSSGRCKSYLCSRPLHARVLCC